MSGGEVKSSGRAGLHTRGSVLNDAPDPLGGYSAWSDDRRRNGQRSRGRKPDQALFAFCQLHSSAREPSISIIQMTES